MPYNDVVSLLLLVPMVGKNLGFLKKVLRFFRFFRFFRFLGFIGFIGFFCTKTEHDSTIQKYTRKKNIPYMVRPSPSHGLQHTKLQASCENEDKIIDKSHYHN